jgi:uncharacterized protein YPO0396
MPKKINRFIEAHADPKRCDFTDNNLAVVTSFQLSPATETPIHIQGIHETDKTKTTVTIALSIPQATRMAHDVAKAINELGWRQEQMQQKGDDNTAELQRLKDRIVELEVDLDEALEKRDDNG